MARSAEDERQWQSLVAEVCEAARVAADQAKDMLALRDKVIRQIPTDYHGREIAEWADLSQPSIVRIRKAG